MSPRNHSVQIQLANSLVAATLSAVRTFDGSSVVRLPNMIVLEGMTTTHST